MDNRYYWIDCIKVLLIYLMILGHIEHTNSEFKLWLYTFHMPCFFVVSGYLQKSSKPSTLFKYLFVPVALISIVSWIHRCFTMYFLLKIPWNINYYVVYPIIGFGLFPSSGISADIFTGLWYVEILFLFKIITSRWSKIRHHLIILLICLLYIIAKDFGYIATLFNNIIVERFFYCYFFFTTGYYLKLYNVIYKFQNRLRSYSINSKQLLNTCFIFTISFILLCVLCYLSSLMGMVDIYSSNYGQSKVLFFIVPILYFISFALLFLQAENFISNYGFIKILSMGTLLILGTHSMLIANFYRILNFFNLSQIPFWLLGICILVVLYPIICFLDRKYPIMLGKKTKSIILKK